MTVAPCALKAVNLILGTKVAELARPGGTKVALETMGSEQVMALIMLQNKESDLWVILRRASGTSLRSVTGSIEDRG